VPFVPDDSAVGAEEHLIRVARHEAGPSGPRSAVRPEVRTAGARCSSSGPRARPCSVGSREMQWPCHRCTVRRSSRSLRSPESRGVDGRSYLNYVNRKLRRGAAARCGTFGSPKVWARLSGLIEHPGLDPWDELAAVCLLDGRPRSRRDKPSASPSQCRERMGPRPVRVFALSPEPKGSLPFGAVFVQYRRAPEPRGYGP
jgi:hypothetical protein